MTELEFLKSIGVNKEGTYSEDAYVVTLDNSSEFGKMYSLLDTSDKLFEMEENQVVTEQGTSLNYESEEGDFIISLIADFDGDVYNLVVNKI